MLTDRSAVLSWLRGIGRPDGLTVAAAAVWVLLAAPFAVPLVDPTATHFVSYYLIEIAMLPFVVAGLWDAARRQSSTELSGFLERVGAAHAAWLMAAVLRWPLQQTMGPQAEQLVRDSFYALYYVLFLWALDWLYLSRERSLLEKLLSFSGSLILVGGSMLYLRVLPRLVLEAESIQFSGLRLYVALDLYLAARLFLQRRRLLSSRPRQTFVLLGIAGLCLALADALEVAYDSGLLVYSSTSLLNVSWLVFYVPLFLSTRVAAAAAGQVAPDEPLQASPAARGSRWSPLIVYGFALPVLHVMLYSSGWGMSVLERPRGYLVLGWLVVLAALIFVQRAVTARRVASTERALLSSYDQIRRLVNAREATVESERKRLARELHDELGQLLVALQLDVAWLRSRSQSTRADVAERLQVAADLVQSALGFSHRMATRLHPGVLDELGLVAALKVLADETAGRSRCEVRLVAADNLPEIDPETELRLYRVAQECLDASVEHSRARRVEIELSSSAAGMQLEIRDDGRGGPGQRPEIGLSLLSVEERVRAVGGSFATASGIEGRGLTIRALVPPARAGVESEARKGGAAPV